MGLMFNHVHIKTPDVAATRKFYEDNYGATFKAEMNGGVQLDLHGTQINITIIQPTQNHVQYHGIEHLALTTDDYPGTMAKLRANGVTVLEELVSNGRRVAFLESPDKAQMEIIERI